MTITGIIDRIIKLQRQQERAFENWQRAVDDKDIRRQEYWADIVRNTSNQLAKQLEHLISFGEVNRIR